ncbi:SDR family NAD(P)-dependent oxidoreductase [Leucobacter massiliensis]|uniref:Short-chain dehydrogenase n=1 Tax=Leucobacter massiliensis TaxID=1686285 RepID=A0A2S9QR30_9MICO|nr:SDR family NAD(P)-dependent oxidoreductase [Leucobacter massiliensis]PRI12046.1 short-chain dehydrogenase [Leucobacter massiliensis]
MQVSGKLIVITGAGNGMGRETALQLLEKGARVAGVDLSAEGLSETKELAGANGARFSEHALSVTDRAAVEALPAAVEEAHGQPADGIVNMAGIIHRFAKVQDLDIEEIERVMNVNYWGTVYPVKAFLPVLLRRPEALIVNFASMGALLPVPGQGAYGSSKGAIRLFTDTLYAELADTRVQVHLVFPGAIATNISANSGVSAPGGGAATAEDAQKSAMQPMDVRDAGAIIVRGIESGSYRVMIGKDAKTFDRLARLSPTKSIRMIAKKVSEAMGL